MIEFEADDALAAAAATAAADPRVDRVVICTPDKDLAQCVRGTRVVQLNRRTRVDRSTRRASSRSSASRPASIPDYLALVGDSSDGYPGLRGLGRRSRRPRCWRATGTSKRFRKTRAHVGRQREQRRRAGADARPRARARVPLPRSRDAAHGHPALRLDRRPRVDRPDSRPFHRSRRVSTPLSQSGDAKPPGARGQRLGVEARRSVPASAGTSHRPEVLVQPARISRTTWLRGSGS